MPGRASRLERIMTRHHRPPAFFGRRGARALPGGPAAAARSGGDLHAALREHIASRFGDEAGSSDWRGAASEEMADDLATHDRGALPAYRADAGRRGRRARNAGPAEPSGVRFSPAGDVHPRNRERRSVAATHRPDRCAWACVVSIRPSSPGTAFRLPSTCRSTCCSSRPLSIAWRCGANGPGWRRHSSRSS